MPSQVFFVITLTCIITPLFASYAPVKHAAFHHYCNTQVASRFRSTLSHLVSLQLRDCVREFWEDFLHSFTSKLMSSLRTCALVSTRAFRPYLCAMMLLQQSHLLSSLRLHVRLHIYFFIPLGVQNGEGDYRPTVHYYFQH